MKACSKCKEVRPLDQFHYKKKGYQGRSGGYASECKACVSSRNKAFYRANRDRLKRQALEWRGKNKGRYTEYLKSYGPKRHRELKAAALEIYGKVCACCGESGFEFLTLDHVDNDGHLHRRAINQRSIYEWLKNNGYPSTWRLQTLCFNCNFAKRYNGGVCPHQKNPEGSETIPKGSTAKRPEARSPSDEEGEDIVRSGGKPLAA